MCFCHGHDHICVGLRLVLVVSDLHARYHRHRSHSHARKHSGACNTPVDTTNSQTTHACNLHHTTRHCKRTHSGVCYVLYGRHACAAASGAGPGNCMAWLKTYAHDEGLAGRRFWQAAGSQEVHKKKTRQGRGTAAHPAHITFDAHGAKASAAVPKSLSGGSAVPEARPVSAALHSAVKARRREESCDMTTRGRQRLQCPFAGQWRAGVTPGRRRRRPRDLVN